MKESINVFTLIDNDQVGDADINKFRRYALRQIHKGLKLNKDRFRLFRSKHIIIAIADPNKMFFIDRAVPENYKCIELNIYAHGKLL